MHVFLPLLHSHAEYLFARALVELAYPREINGDRTFSLTPGPGIDPALHGCDVLPEVNAASNSIYEQSKALRKPILESPYYAKAILVDDPGLRFLSALPRVWSPAPPIAPLIPGLRGMLSDLPVYDYAADTIAATERASPLGNLVLVGWSHPDARHDLTIIASRIRLLP